MPTVIDDYIRECLAIVVARRLSTNDVLQALTDLFVGRGPPSYIRSGNGPEFVAKVVRGWLGRVGVTTLFVEPGQPVGERLQRIVQRQAAGRAAGPGDLLFTEGRRGADCALAAARQHGQAAQRAGLSAVGARSGVGLAVC
jgi:transposase InsO family protein